MQQIASGQPCCFHASFRWTEFLHPSLCAPVTIHRIVQNVLREGVKDTKKAPPCMT